MINYQASISMHAMCWLDQQSFVIETAGQSSDIALEESSRLLFCSTKIAIHNSMNIIASGGNT